MPIWWANMEVSIVMGVAHLNHLSWMVHLHGKWNSNPIRSMYGIYANIGCILMVNVTIYSIHGSYGNGWWYRVPPWLRKPPWLNSLNEASTDRAISQPRHTHWLTLACRSSLVASTAWGKKHDLGYSIRCHNDPLYTPMNMYEYNMYIYIYILNQQTFHWGDHPVWFVA
jgi:hypothetical protein